MKSTISEMKIHFIPKENHVAYFINDLVNSLPIEDQYFFGRPRLYNARNVLKLNLFAYTRETFTSRKIKRLADENLYARWLTEEQFTSYRTIARFCVSSEMDELLQTSLDTLVTYLRERYLIDNALFIDGTKLLADANKYSFVWKKNTIRFDQMNRNKMAEMIHELKDAYQVKSIPEESNLTLDMIE